MCTTPDLRPHTLPPPAGLIECASVVDVGPGIRPFRWYVPESHVCVEPFHVYADILEFHGYEVVRGAAPEALSDLKADAVYMLDVLEHMERDAGLTTLQCAKSSARRQVVVYTPKGFLEQEGDAWDLGGDYWQRHRSGWVPEDFPGWAIEDRGRGFFALHNP